MKNKFLLNGVVPPIVTPVDELENVDKAGLERVIEYVMDGGVHGVFVNGSNGEFYGLDFENQKRAIEVAVEYINGKIPVYAGASAITTKEAVRLAKMSQDVGADALTVLTPMFIQPSEQELFDHFSDIAVSCDLPVILYNNPGKTNNQISPRLLKRLLDVENICGIKNTSMDFSMTMKYIETANDRDDFAVFGGIDYYVYATLCHGGAGCVAGTANVAPRLVVDIYENYAKGDHLAALNAQKALMPIRDAYGLGTFPVMMKVMLNLLGVNAGKPIRPVSYVGEDVLRQTEKILIESGLLSQ
ncbi:dihydrodipicolinate synthase family protein [Oceanispirochaeta sp.]|uniref:dihydrodipicolinate synthase family protein n=1 Tax=Oceanispirochaeta sp. TaxID=2035350 RepID=UPI002639298A|nr:dihydrodipicolinate synthase family protein [Oceanispirochaeta sp.]MDA3957738.1 dihydrodipicolinate synthase family protein [Oceanispirochaeta sp.]